MTTLAPLLSVPTYVTPASSSSAASSPAAVTATPTASTTTSLGQAASPSLALYSSSGLLDGTSSLPRAIWEAPQTDAISTRMAADASAGDLGSRWKGLGRAMMDQATLLGPDNAAYSQSVLVSDQARQGSSGVQAILRDQLHHFGSNAVSLSVKTASGAQVELSLSSNSDGVAVDVKLTAGKLTDDERAALGQLGDAFEAAVQGLAGQPPTLSLSGLTQFDSSKLASIDLKASLSGGTSVQFHADASQRSVALSNTAGSMKVQVDAGKDAITGSADQRQRAIASYLQQFDSAASRGHADGGLTSLFKDAFSQLNGSATPAGVASAASASPAPLLSASSDDRSMLSGLADFTASITGATSAPNPLHHDEVDGFDYQVSQHTSLSGASQANRAISQQSSSTLKASYHESLQPDLPLKLDTTRQSQNYTYHQINDQASSQVDIGYHLGYLVQAQVRQSASQDAKVSKYVMGDLVSTTDTPLQAQIVRDFSAQLQDGRDARAGDGDGGSRQRQLMAQIGTMGLLQGDPTAVRAHGTQIVGS
ncbi:hypothetical protein [Herbaspirillum sp. NPDC087042]|uniref:hypothetical protein n=1 Tax=Herbaspirillum sp. NPDC087042 TaxID=3364004 RepID=UPI0037F2351A